MFQDYFFNTLFPMRPYSLIFLLIFFFLLVSAVKHSVISVPVTALHTASADPASVFWNKTEVAEAACREVGLHTMATAVRKGGLNRYQWTFSFFPPPPPPHPLSLSPRAPVAVGYQGGGNGLARPGTSCPRALRRGRFAQN